MIRPIAPDDMTGLIAIAEAVGLFEPNQLQELGKMLSDYFDGDSDRFWVADEDEKDGLVGVAYCAPEPMTNGTWNLLLIAVRPDHQGKGHGTALIQYVEQTLTVRGARLLLVETSASFEDTRAFYLKCGYDQEARIRDFYETGADKIVYRKALAARQH